MQPIELSNIFKRTTLCAGLTLIAGTTYAASQEAPQPGAVYVMTNEAAGNGIAVFARAAGGTVALQGTVATGGLGVGALLDSQDALILNDDHSLLFAANSGSDEITVFAVSADGLELTEVSRVASGGDRPVSLTINDSLLYVLNSRSEGNITGFTVGENGALTPLADSTQSLSTSEFIPCSELPFPREATGDCNVVSPGEVEFSPDGRFLVVTERLINQFSVYPVSDAGVAGSATQQPSAGETPFGFAFDAQGRMFVSEAFEDRPAEGAASSYNLSEDGELSVITNSLHNTENASCWLVVTPDGRYTYTANPQAGTITGYAINENGSLRLLDADGVTGGGEDRTGDPRDIELSADGRYLYSLNNVGFTLAIHQVNGNGSPTRLPGARGFPPNSVGIAAF